MATSCAVWFKFEGKQVSKIRISEDTDVVGFIKAVLLEERINKGAGDVVCKDDTGCEVNRSMKVLHLLQNNYGEYDRPIQLILSADEGIPQQKKQKVEVSLSSEIIDCQNFNELHTVYNATASNLVIYGPKGFGKSTCLMWLYTQLQHAIGGEVIYCDLVCNRLDDFDVCGKVVLLDNAQRSELADRSCLNRAKRYVAAYSPQSLLNQHSLKLTSKKEFPIYLKPFSDDEVERYISNYNHGLDEKTKKYIGLVSSNIPLFVWNCMEIITIHLKTQPTAPASQLTDSLNVEFCTSINSLLDGIFFKIKKNREDIAELIINAFRGHDTDALIPVGIVYRAPGGKIKLTHSRFLQRAYIDKGLSKFDKHWHSLEKLVMLLLFISDTKVCTFPKDKETSKSVTIPKVTDTYVANSIDEVSTQMTKCGSTLYAVECIYNQPTFDIVVVDTRGRRAFFIQVSQQSYTSHSKPTEGFMDPYLEELAKHYTVAKYTGFYVFATIQMQQYTKKSDIYFMDINQLKSIEV